MALHIREIRMTQDPKQKGDAKQTGDLSRRSILQNVGIGMAAGAAGTAALTGVSRPAAAVPSVKRTSAKYQETEHVRRAYTLARF
jgi:hypothetical protein